jgi:hypothetical protein
LRNNRVSAQVGQGKARSPLSISESKDLVVVEQPPVEEAPPPPPPRAAPRPPEPDFAERVMLFVELRPWLTALLIFATLAILHVVFLNIAGVADGLYIGDKFLLTSGASAIEIALLAFVAYNVVLPTLLGHACIFAYDSLRPSLMLDDRGYGDLRAGIVDPFFGTRLAAGALWAALLTPVFGELLRTSMPGEGASNALLTIWMYVRIAVTFGLLGANVGYVFRLHHRFREVTGEHMRIDLFDLAPLRPVARYAREVALYLIVLLALAGPAIAQPEAMTQSAIVFALGLVFAAVAVVGAMSGTRSSISAAKKTAITELSTYARELWRRAYAGQRIVEAMAIPALGAMITTRDEIRRLTEWPGGWSVAARFALLALIPLLTWFGGQILARLIEALAR